MPTSLYNFQYVPLTGRLPGKSFVSQTEQAINGLAQYVYENSTNYEAVKAIAQKAEEDSSSALEYSEEALDKAQTALETVGRAYIKTTSAVDLNDYFDSELLLILSTESTNLPASISGYLTVMSSDTHDYCMQVYIGVDGSVYKRTATISNNTPTFGAWSETPITLSSLQTILANYTTVDASNIGVNAQTDNSTAWGNAIGGGEIVSGEQRLVTGGTVYPLSVDVDIADKRISNIEKLLQGNLYDYQSDSTSAYTKSVPSGAMPYAGLEKVGGKTIVMNQLCGNGVLPSSVTYIGDGTYKINGTISDAAYPILSAIKTVAGHKYYLYLNTGLYAQNVMLYNNGQGLVLYGSDIISTAVQTATGSDFIFFKIDAGTYNNVVVKAKTIDLTLMFGAGNEPSTAAEFEAMFPADTYPFSTGTLLSAGVTQVVSKDSNNATLQTYSIPASVQALEGYGWSAGSVYNEIDFERKVFIKRVARVVLDGTQTISGSNWSPSADGVGWYYPYALTNNKITGSGGITPNVVTNKYIARCYDELVGKKEGISFVTDGSYGLILWQTDATLNNATAISNYLSANPITVYYELATPIETDISAYLTDDNLIQVESGGTLTFPNSNGTDYQIPVPSEEEYMIDLQSAIGG